MGLDVFAVTTFTEDIQFSVLSRFTDVMFFLFNPPPLSLLASFEVIQDGHDI